MARKFGAESFAVKLSDMVLTDRRYHDKLVGAVNQAASGGAINSTQAAEALSFIGQLTELKTVFRLVAAFINPT